jgi:hypothetical protein
VKVIPDWVPPAPKPVRNDGTGQISPARANEAAKPSTPRDLQVGVIARDQVIPILYGGPERMAGLVYCVATPRELSMAGKLVFAAILCEGPVESITDFQANNEALPSWISIVAYDGSQTTVDPWLAAAIPGFNETLNGTAYFVAQVIPQDNTGFPVITAQVKGLRTIRDPRTSSIGWSRNPALCTAHYMEHFGALPVDDTYTIEAANRCDEIVTGSAGSEKRSEFTLALMTKLEISRGIDVLRQYIPARVVNAGDAWRIVADMPRAPAHSFGPSNIDGDSPPTLARKGTKGAPNVVDVEYTDEQTIPWESMIATAPADGGASLSNLLLSRVSLPGIRKYSQAYRFAVERLNHYTLEDTTAKINVFDYGVNVLPGDLCTVSEAAFGWAAKQFVVEDATDNGNGRWALDLREFDPLAYSGLVQIAPTMPETSLSSPLVVNPARNVALSQVLTPESNLPSTGLGTSIIYQSRMRVTWDESDDPYIGSYRVVIRRGGNEVSQYAVARGVGLFLSQPAQQLVTYDVDVYAVNTLGVLSPAVTNSIFIDGKTAPPSDVPAIIQAMEIGGEVLLSWEPAADFDVIRYEWRVDYGDTGAAWEQMSVLDRIDGLRARFRGVPEGTHRFCVRAVDSVGNYSTNSRCAVLTVTMDENAFVRGNLFVNPTLVGMVRIDTPPNDPPVAGTYPRWVTNDPSKSWDVAMPSPIDSGTLPVFTYGASAGVASWTGEIYDIGADVTAAFKIDDNVTVFSGTVSTFLEHSMDGNTWTREDLTGGIGWTGAARFVRPYLEGSAGASWMVSGGVTVEIVANSTSESGQATSSASTYSRVYLQKQYAKAVSCVVTPINSTTASFPTIDNFVIGIGVQNYFDVYLHKANGQQTAQDYIWTFEGV